MHSGVDMKPISERLILLCTLGFAWLLLRDYLRLKRAMEGNAIVEDVELFLKAARLQELILPEQQIIIDELGKTWIGEAYRGLTKPMNWRELVKQQLEQP
jgi:hypothetical protein